ncbi:Penicillin-binding protein 1B, isoform gamma [Candidatus Erwinia haradaeae]|uniref:Penicillin-binding protein 1B n=1 Tax=Candidatus Erwinia haradaeae TaxID=1922217 RepID=A0A451DK20_9GAMM|nr:bifunctional glycosyl transferase/transpeptidase [Candidatus Erwinia haradaeae]VFP87085.1 Penicillin-binding protein 1B, isoform gamma [Candidatus Erwinia haradaeae]
MRCNKTREHPVNKYFMKIIIKYLFTGTLMIIGYGFWLDYKIQYRINGKVWRLPAVVYGRIVTLQPNMPYTQKNMISLLEGAQYRKVMNSLHLGEFTVKQNSIEMIRRPFDFPKSPEDARHICLTFNNNYLKTIHDLDNGRDLGCFRLDPRLITFINTPNGEQRLFLARSNFPDLLVQTLLITEDRHFYHHPGISLHAIARAFLVNIIAGHAIQGGSTLTQQLVKNLFLTNQRSLLRKATEAYMAIIMDARYDKDRILELYLNEVYLGQIGNNQIHGFPLASLYYFGRPVDELTLDQQALLVAMVKGASLYNPWRNPGITLERRNLLLRLIRKQNIIDSVCFLKLNARPLGVNPEGNLITTQPSFMQLVYHELQAHLGNKMQDLSGVKIFTTLDPLSQNAAEESVEEGIALLRKVKNLNDLESAMVVVDRFTGEIRAMVGGSNPKFLGYNRALYARRSIGSLAKPAIYLTAFSKPELYRLNTWIADNPIQLRQLNGQIWRPRNNSRLFSGHVMLIDALTYSINIPAVNLGMTLGLNSILETWSRLGVPKNQLKPIPAILLGALNLTPIEVAQTFQTIASGGNRGQLSTLCSVLSDNGTVLYERLPQSIRSVSPQAAYLTLYAMQQVVDHGTASTLGALYPEAHLAGKTGTTNYLVDSWFSGIDGKEVTITWVGRDNNQTTQLYGVSGAMKIYQLYLKKHAPFPLTLALPENVVLMPVNSLGKFSCKKDTISRYLPIWTTMNLYELCQSSNQPQKKHRHNLSARMHSIFKYFIAAINK